MKRVVFRCLLLAASASACVQAWATDLVLIQGENIKITNHDMMADSQRMPPEMRPLVLQRPDQVAQIANNLYMRRGLAQKAEQEGLANSPEVLAALQIARDKVLSDAMLAKIDRDTNLTDDKVEGAARNFYNANPDRYKMTEQVQVRHILIAGQDDAAKDKATQLLTELKAGGDFATLAKANSADTASAAKGGDLGFFTKGRMVAEFDEVAFTLQKTGELSELVKTKFGYHILQLQAKKPAGIRPFEEVRAELIKDARNVVLQDGRVQAAQAIQQGATVDNEAIAAFAATFAPAR